MQQPLVSIVVPCYNQIQYLEECLQSLVAQTYQNWEAVVVDDASPDEDMEAVVALINDRRITYVRHEQNRGPAAGRNTGIRRAKSNLVLPVDGDDKLEPTYLQKVLPLLDDRSENMAAFSDFRLFGEKEAEVHFRVYDVKTILEKQWIPGAGTLFHKAVWEQVGGYCEDNVLRGNEDWDFWMGAARRNLNVGHVPEPLYLYRQVGGSVSVGLRYRDYATRELMHKRHQDLFTQHNMGAIFLAEGYRRSAVASWQKGEYQRAARLGLHSFRLRPRAFVKSALRALRRAARIR